MKHWIFSIALATSLNLQANTALIEEHIKPYPDFPKPGILFRWYSPLLRNPKAFKEVIGQLATRYREQNIQAIVGLDSRGFIFGSALAYEMDLPFVVARKAGKLPGETIQVKYGLEYGESVLEMEVGSIIPGERVLLIDDLLATGGTLKAAHHLVTQLGGEVVEAVCLIELDGLNGKDNLPCPFHSVVTLGE